jgi:hypothetical protein
VNAVCGMTDTPLDDLADVHDDASPHSEGSETAWLRPVT